jgi:hypothetical protein
MTRSSAAQSVQTRITAYLASHSDRKRAELQALHEIILRLLPGCRLWYLDGKDEDGRTVSNPSIGYGLLKKTYADGRTRDFYQVGLSANTAGISIYIMGLDDRTYLAKTWGGKLGKATVTGYCIKLRSLRYIDLATLESAIRDGITRASA